MPAAVRQTFGMTDVIRVEKEDANKTVVLVEDDYHIADLVDLYLRKAGYRVLQASDANARPRVDRQRAAAPRAA